MASFVGNLLSPFGSNFFAPSYVRGFLWGGSSFCGSISWSLSTIFCTFLKDCLSFLYLSTV